MLCVPFVLRSQTNEWISDPEWGFEFQVPENWIYEKDYTGVALANAKIEGIILVIPSETTTISDIRDQMNEGLQEEGTLLTRTENLQNLSENRIAGFYSGYYNYQEVRAYIIGKHFPERNGVYILALAPPHDFSNTLISVSQAIASGMRITNAVDKTARSSGMHDISVGSIALMNYFAGTYYSYSSAGFATGGTERRLAICANGKFFYSSESGYSGDAGTAGAWGTANQSGNAGEWSINGTKESGVVELHYSNGEKEILNYRICGDGCIYFGQIKYAFEKAAVCD